MGAVPHPVYFVKQGHKEKAHQDVIAGIGDVHIHALGQIMGCGQGIVTHGSIGLNLLRPPTLGSHKIHKFSRRQFINGELNTGLA